ncbi:DUF3592 domain-containing protein [Chitinophaga oryzae]|uniref:DUF3592 domain-containing protein n=1 Tax=Chitinophaga oryzae TaxID=2725414 RepID=A0ABX6LCY8_9BACT|nr:DUF3592 domain-containing protein [Chitinophaga oryzae]QJB37984.1 DUF3592 domain-containing protein [Chitinophaga oryzae]
MKYKICLLAGCLLLAASLYKLKESLDFIRNSERATGTVTSLEMHDDSYSPVFVVTTKDGRQLDYHHAASSKPASWEVGERAVFLYDPANPGAVRMMRYFWIFNWSIVFMALGMPLIILGGGYYWLRRFIEMPQESYTLN